MRILVVGSGAREHSLCWRLKGEGAEVWCAPGNAGMASVCRVTSIAAEDHGALMDLVRRESIDFTIVGPEKPLSEGIVDTFRANGLKILGPAKAAAKLESSKAFAKEIMESAGVPTAAAKVFYSASDTLDYCRGRSIPIVLKADGLAAGKGVVVVTEAAELGKSVSYLFDILKSSQVLVEDFLDGVEATFIVATDGVNVAPLPTAHDYKRLKDNDEGPNTGGMGAVSPTPRMSARDEAWVVDRVVKPVLRAMHDRGTPFTGFLYAGLMIPRREADRPQGIKVVEFNARLGDPECEVILPRVETKLVPLFERLAHGTGSLGGEDVQLHSSSERAVCVVLGSRGYPEAPVNGDTIHGLDLAALVPDSVVFHAGTKQTDKGFVTAGGRVLTVMARGSGDSVVHQVYKAADLVQFAGRQMRRDIGS